MTLLRIHVKCFKGMASSSTKRTIANKIYRLVVLRLNIISDSKWCWQRQNKHISLWTHITTHKFQVSSFKMYDLDKRLSLICHTEAMLVVFIFLRDSFWFSKYIIIIVISVIARWMTVAAAAAAVATSVATI